MYKSIKPIKYRKLLLTIAARKKNFFFFSQTVMLVNKISNYTTINNSAETELFFF
jgi:hypothetical protein